MIIHLAKRTGTSNRKNLNITYLKMNPVKSSLWEETSARILSYFANVIHLFCYSHLMFRLSEADMNITSRGILKPWVLIICFNNVSFYSTKWLFECCSSKLRRAVMWLMCFQQCGQWALWSDMFNGSDLVMFFVLNCGTVHLRVPSKY